MNHVKHCGRTFIDLIVNERLLLYFLRRSSTRALAVFDSPPLARGRLSAATSSTLGELPVIVLTDSAISRDTAWLRALSLRIEASFTSTFRSKVSRPSRLSP